MLDFLLIQKNEMSRGRYIRHRVGLQYWKSGRGLISYYSVCDFNDVASKHEFDEPLMGIFGVKQENLIVTLILLAFQRKSVIVLYKNIGFLMFY